MKLLVASTFVCIFSFGGVLAAETSFTKNVRDIVPEKVPIDIQYGSPITLGRAQAVIAIAINKANERGWKISFAVLDSGGNVVALARMDGAQLSSPGIAEHKARTAVTFRRSTLFYENSVDNGQPYQLSVDGIIASRGGVPLIENGKLIGAIGAAGGAGSQDQICAETAAATVN